MTKNYSSNLLIRLDNKFVDMSLAKNHRITWYFRNCSVFGRHQKRYAKLINRGIIMKCAYCDKKDKMTREHIIPNAFIKGMKVSEQVRWTRAAPIRVVGSDLVIKDVCAKCNGGELSKLDSYCLNLIKKFNNKIDINKKNAIFKYDYHKLARWLLKVSYNASRASKSNYTISLFENYKDYIMGKSQNTNPISIHMAYLDLKYDKVEEKFYHLEKESEYFIDHFRITQMSVKNFQAHKSVSKLIIINSFAFIITIYDDVKKEYIKKYEDAIKATDYKYKKMDKYGRLKLSKDSNIFIHSFISSRILQRTFPKRKIIEKKSFKLVEISKKELENNDYNQIKQFLFNYMIDKDSVEENYQKLIISISGYDNDSRELFEIESFRNYVRGILKKFPDIIWFLNIEMDFQFVYPFFLGYCYSNKMRNRINLDNKLVEEFLEKSFTAVNRITNNYVVDKSVNEDFTERLIESINKMTMK